ncbi:MAG: AAA family ATPase [Chryseolinea sp.]
MELLERDSYVENLQALFERADKGTGHVVFVAGESGIGKSSVVNQFTDCVSGAAATYVGYCDSLFTPRPLGPLFDVAGQIGKGFLNLLKTEKDRGQIFSAFHHELSVSVLPVVLVIEDIHWADEATIDFIKLLGRRIERLRCLLVLTYRDNEIHALHPVKSVFSDIPPVNFSKIALAPLSRAAVDQLAGMKGLLTGDKIYDLTGGNPFYVAEVLTNSGSGIPERVKDSILSVFYNKDERVQGLWELLSILPLQIESSVIEMIEPDFFDHAEESIRNGVIILRHDNVSFKHELFRDAIEGSMSLYRKRNLHGKVLKALLATHSYSGNLPLLVHHACHANERSMVATLAPQAGDEASTFGSHIEAAKFYNTAIEFTASSDESIADLYARHAYECYLINQITSAVISQEKALAIWRKKKDVINEGAALRMLSRHLWFQGRCKEVMQLAFESVRVLEDGTKCRQLALGYSNLCALYMVSDDVNKTIHWGNKAVELADKLGDTEVLVQALCNIGTVLMKYSLPGGVGKINESLSIALKHEFHDHVAAAYTNLACMFVLSKQFKKAEKEFETGLSYCEPRDLNIWKYYMESQRIRLLMDTCRWVEAEVLARSIYDNPVHTAVIRIGAIVGLARLKMRRGEFEEARLLVREGRSIADPTTEAHTMTPAFTAQLELCWLLNEPAPEEEIAEAVKVLFQEKSNSWYYGELAYWKQKCGIESPEDQMVNFVGPYQFEQRGEWRAAAEVWKQLGCKYEQALTLFEGDELAQRESLSILDALDLQGVVTSLKLKMRNKGVRHIPRGMRDSTRNNPAMLTERQVEVLTLLRNGKQNKEIADKLFISSKTVDHHISAILSKLEVSSRSKAVLEAEKLGILK